MCGRFAMSAKTKDIEKFRNDLKLKPIAPIKQSYNIAPGQNITGLKFSEKDFSIFNWGLNPSWVNTISNPTKLINARAETLSQKPAFKSLLNGKRCIILASGYYEWQKNTNRKTPYYIFLKNEPIFGFAGLWDNCTNEEAEIECSTIITCNSSENISHIHSRMPVIITKDRFDDWLSERQTTELLQPFSSAVLSFYPVSNFVNSPKNNSEECIKEYYESEKTLF